MRAELTETHTGAGRNSAVSQMTGLVTKDKYYKLKSMIQRKINESYSKMDIDNQMTPNSKITPEYLEQEMEKLNEAIITKINTEKAQMAKSHQTETKKLTDRIAKAKIKHEQELLDMEVEHEKLINQWKTIFADAIFKIYTHKDEIQLANYPGDTDSPEEWLDRIFEPLDSTTPQPSAPPPPPPIAGQRLDYCQVQDTESKMNYVFIAVHGEMRLHTFNDNGDRKIYTLKELALHSTTHPAAYFEFVSTDQDVVTLKVQDELEKKDLAAWLISHSTLIHLYPGFIKQYEHLKSHKIELRANLPTWFRQHYSHLLNTATQAPPRPTRRKYTVHVPGL